MEGQPSGRRPRELAKRVLPIARQILEGAVEGWPTSLRWHFRKLTADVPPEHAVTTVLGAVASVILDLEEGSNWGGIEVQEPTAVLAQQLVRLAYNRARRGERRTKGKPGFEPALALAPAESQKREPAPEFLARIRELNGYMLSTLDATDFVIWTMAVAGYTDAEIAAEVKRHRTTVYRRIRQFTIAARRFLDSQNSRDSSPSS